MSSAKPEFVIKAEEEVQYPSWQVIVKLDGASKVCGTFSTRTDAQSAIWMYEWMQARMPKEA